MDTHEDEAYHSGQYLQTEQLDSGDSQKHAAPSPKRSARPETKHVEESGSTSKSSFGKEEGYESLEVPEAYNAETSRRGKPKAVTPHSINADTPTTSLAKGLASFNLRSRYTHQQTSVDSPLSEYSSGNFPSMSDAGYASMPSLEKPTDTSMDAVKKPSSSVVSSVPPTRITKGSESESMDIDVVGTPTEDKVQVLPKPSAVATAVLPAVTTTTKPFVFTPVTVTVMDAQQQMAPQQQRKIEGAANVVNLWKMGSLMTGANEARERVTQQREKLSPSSTKHRSKSKSPSPSPGSSSLSASPSHIRSESPKSVPSVGENIEIITDGGVSTAMDDEIVNSSRPEGATMKRSASSGTDTMAEYYGRMSKKAPRLEDDRSGSSAAAQKAIRVPTIVSPSGSGRQSPMSKGRSPQSREARSPVSINIFGEALGGSSSQRESIERVFVAGLTPFLAKQLQLQLQQLQQPKVNFKDIGDISKSSRDTQQVSADRNAMPLEAWKDSVAKTMERGSIADRLSPQPARSPGVPISSPMSVSNLVSHSPLRRSQSPQPVASPSRSPAHSPRPPKDSQRMDSVDSTKVRGGARESGSGTGTGSRSETGIEIGKDGKPGPRNALLQVSEAHLAILPDEDGDTPLHLAIIHENTNLTQYLIKLIVGVYMNLDIANNMRQTPLHLAVITRQPHMVQLLVEAGASVNFPDRKGNTALHLAAARRDTRILQILSQATSPLPDFNCKNFAGLTPAHVATKEASIDVLKYLFQMGANKNAPDACSGRTPLHYAVEQENFILVNYLLESNCSVNVATFAGNTPLHIAAGRRLKEIVALLMAYGANPAIANGEGDFPSDLPASLLMQRAKMNAH